MSDESYYRFRNSVTDLRDCEDVIDRLFNGFTDDGQPMPEDELHAARRLIACCVDVVTLVADQAGLVIDLDDVTQSIEDVLRAANDAPLEARSGSVAAHILLSKHG